MRISVWIFGNQLLARSTLLEKVPRSASLLMIESQARGRLYRYHKKKLVLIYSAMRHYAEKLRSQGWTVDYQYLGDTADFKEGVERHLLQFHPEEIITLHPADYSQLESIRKLERQYGLSFKLLPNDLFLTEIEEFQRWAQGKKRLLMESRYRLMRRRLKILVDEGGRPAGGKWNYDSENRLNFSPEVRPGQVGMFSPDRLTRKVMKDVEHHFPDHPGSTHDFDYPVTEEQSLQHLRSFASDRLDGFGPYQDMMATGEPHLYHSILSPLLNIGLLHPLDVIEEVLDTYESGKARLQSVEAMIRQIMGWREFIYGAYWTAMPEYGQANFLGADASLPEFFWTGNTDMRCLKEVIQQTIALGYAHHIQRLMVLANFCTLAGISPPEVLHWFMEMYLDAYEWVMLPNIYGMGTYADGGYIATKPYVATGAYINRMSDYCQECRFDVKKRIGPDACPFNYLFWDFLERNRERLLKNPRLALLYGTWDRKPPEERKQIRKESQRFLAGLKQRILSYSH